MNILTFEKVYLKGKIKIRILYIKKPLQNLTKCFLEFKNSSKEDLFDFMKPFPENEPKKENNNNQDIIDYIKKGDCLLMIKKNKLKIIQRENNGLFDLSNIIEINDNPKNKASHIIFEKDDLEYFLKNFNAQSYISYYPSFKKIIALSQFLDAVNKGAKLGNNKIIIFQTNPLFFYSSLISFLNFVSFVSRRNRTINQNKKANEEKKLNLQNVKSLKSIEKENKEKENLNIMNVFPFGCFGEESEENDDIQSLDDSIENTIDYEEYKEFIIKDPLIHAKLLKIINKIIVQLSTRNENLRIFGNNNMFNSYENLASFVNYPFSNKIPITKIMN